MMCMLRWIKCASQVFDYFLQQLGEDTAAYVRTVCQTIVLTVPKAVIHCQVSSPPLLTSVFLLLTMLSWFEALTMIHSKTPAFQQQNNICSQEETGQTALQYGTGNLFTGCISVACQGASMIRRYSFLRHLCNSCAGEEGPSTPAGAPVLCSDHPGRRRG